MVIDICKFSNYFVIEMSKFTNHFVIETFREEFLVILAICGSSMGLGLAGGTTTFCIEIPSPNLARFGRALGAGPGEAEGFWGLPKFLTFCRF